MPVFVGHAHISSAVRIVRSLRAGKCDADAVFCLESDVLDLGVDFGFDMSGDGLGNLTQGGFRHIHSDRATIVADAKPQLTAAMFIKDGCDGDKTLAKFCETLLGFSGFGLAHGRRWTLRV